MMKKTFEVRQARSKPGMIDVICRLNPNQASAWTLTPGEFADLVGVINKDRDAVIIEAWQREE
jgi:hypothetical protein